MTAHVKTLYAVMVPTSYGHDLQCTLVEDTGEILGSWISSNKYWGRRDLLGELARKHDPATRFPDGYELIEVERWSDVPDAVLSAYRALVEAEEAAAGVTIEHGMDVPPDTEMPEGFELGDGVRRNARCVEKWPGCTDSGYDPACCRFPKSCSATSVTNRVYRAGILEPATEARPSTRVETSDDVVRLIGAAWDDGNARGLDGWIGPNRGADDVDPEAERARERMIDRAFALPSPAPVCTNCKATDFACTACGTRVEEN